MTVEEPGVRVVGGEGGLALSADEDDELDRAVDAGGLYGTVAGEGAGGEGGTGDAVVAAEGSGEARGVVSTVNIGSPIAFEGEEVFDGRPKTAGAHVPRGGVRRGGAAGNRVFRKQPPPILSPPRPTP